MILGFGKKSQLETNSTEESRKISPQYLLKIAESSKLNLTLAAARELANDIQTTYPTRDLADFAPQHLREIIKRYAETGEVIMLDEIKAIDQMSAKPRQGKTEAA